MVKFRESQTAKNLHISFAAETQARTRYDFFANKARDDGYIQIAKIFNETADQEFEHALRFFKFFNGGELEMKWVFPTGVIKDTRANLLSAAALEQYVSQDMYAKFAQIAKEEGFERAEDTFNNIIVAEEHYRKGFGRALTEYVMNFLDDQGVKTQILIATEMGAKLYPKLGFRQTAAYSFYKSAQINNSQENKNIRALTDADYPALFELDKNISAEERKPVLEKFGLNGWGIFEKNSGILKGYYLREIGEGTILASDNESGLELLKFKHSQKKCKTVLPRENLAGNEFLVNNGFKKYSECARMILGEDHNWKPEKVFSRIGGFYG